MFKTIADPFVGQVSLLKVLSGTIRNDDHLVNSRTGADERLHGLFVVRGKDHEPVDALAAGDIGGVAKLAGTATGDTLAPKGQPVHVAPIEQPDAGARHGRRPEDARPTTTKLATALHRLVEEDPALVVARDDETAPDRPVGARARCTSPSPSSGWSASSACRSTPRTVQVRYRETITAPVDAARTRTRSSPVGTASTPRSSCPRRAARAGRGFEFVDKVVGGAVSKGYIPAVERGRPGGHGARRRPGGYPIVDVRVTLTDGKEHCVDSSEMAFRQAGSMALKERDHEGARPSSSSPSPGSTSPCPAICSATCMGDLNSRRGRVQGTEPGDVGEQVVYALVPQSELRRYATDLRSLTGGRGRFPAEHDHYDVLPPTARRPSDAGDPCTTPRWPPALRPTPSSPCARSAAAGAASSPASARTSRPTTSPTAGRRRRSALDHAVRATRTLSLLGRAVEQALVDDDAVLHPAVGDPAQREWDDQAPDSVDDASASWRTRPSGSPTGSSASRPTSGAAPPASPVRTPSSAPLEVLWDAVDTAVAELKAAERTLARGPRPRLVGLEGFGAEVARARSLQSSGLSSTKWATISPSTPSTSTRPRFSGGSSAEYRRMRQVGRLRSPRQPSWAEAWPTAKPTCRVAATRASRSSTSRFQPGDEVVGPEQRRAAPPRPGSRR